MLLSLSIVSAVFFSLYYYFTRNYKYWKNQNVLGPKPIVFFGNLKETAFRRKNMSVLMQDFYKMFPEERVVGIYRMTTPGLLIRDLNIIKHIMIKDFEMFRDRGLALSNEGLGQNLFHADVETWSVLRTQLTPMFTTKKLKHMFCLLSDCADMCTTYLKDKSRNNTEHDIGSLVHKYTVSTIFASVFGVEFNNFRVALDDTLKSLDGMVLVPNYVTELDMMYTGILKKLNISIIPKCLTKYFDELVSTIIAQRNGIPSARGDFMDLMLQLRQMGKVSSLNVKQKESKAIEINQNIMAAQALAFYIGGNETSSATLAYMLHQLALNPEIQEKLKEEIDFVTKVHNITQGEITYESLQDMKYLEKIFLETLRMYPIVDPLTRKAEADYKIPGTDIVIKKDQTVLVSALSIHHDEKYYPKPEVFDPNRFDKESLTARDPLTYMPFGVGPRNCIGLRFGSLQSRLCVAKIISKFRVEPSTKTKISLSINPNRIIIGPKEDIFLNVIPRK